MVDIGVVYNHEAVVAVAVGTHIDWRVLVVVTFEVESERSFYPRGIYSGTNSGSALAEHHEHRLVDIIVDEDNGFPCRPN